MLSLKSTNRHGQNRYFIRHHRAALADASQMPSFTTTGGSPDVDIIQFYNFNLSQCHLRFTLCNLMTDTFTQSIVKAT